MDCESGQMLWKSFRGDAQHLYLTFENRVGEPIDVSGKLLTFSMKLNKADNTCHVYDLALAVRIPYDKDAVKGRYKLSIPSEKTDTLLPGRTYYYDFQLEDDDCDTFKDVATLGWGTKEIMRDVTTGVCDEPDSFPPCG